jgi:soluble lytic murein transglycosylase-like protein
MFKAAIIGLIMVSALLDPLRLTRSSKIKNVELIVEYADKNNHDVYELLALASVESDFNSKAISSAGAVGLFQVMCKYWYKRSGYSSIAECNQKLLNPKPNIKAGATILARIRGKYKQCAGDLAYRCYFAGAGWKKFKGKTAKQIIRYENKVRDRRKILHNLYYQQLIEDIRFRLKGRI